MNAKHVTSSIITHFTDVRKSYDEAAKDVQFYEKEYNDLTHALELMSFNAYEGFKLAKQMQENRRKRREAKDIMQQLEPLYQFMQKNQRFLSDIKKVNADVIKISQKQSCRSYKVRARTDMQIAFDKANGVDLDGRKEKA